PLYQDIKNGQTTQGIEYYLPLFFDGTATLFDYLPKETLIFTSGELPHAAEHFWKDVSERYEEYGVDKQRPLLPPATLFMTSGELFGLIGHYGRTDIQAEPAPAKSHHHNFPSSLPDNVAVDSRAA